MNELKMIFLRHTTLRLQQQKHVLRVQSLLVIKIFVKVASQLINKIARQVAEKSHRLKCNRALVNALFWYLYSFYSKIGNLFNSGSLRSMFGERLLIPFASYFRPWLKVKTGSISDSIQNFKLSYLETVA